MLWAWMSLFWVAFSDIYVRLVFDGSVDGLENNIKPAPLTPPRGRLTSTQGQLIEEVN